MRFRRTTLFIHMLLLMIWFTLSIGWAQTSATINTTDTETKTSSPSDESDIDKSTKDPTSLDQQKMKSKSLSSLFTDLAQRGTERLRPDVRNGLIRVATLTFKGSKLDLATREALSRMFAHHISEQPNILQVDPIKVHATMRIFAQQEIDLTLERAISIGRLLGARFLLLGEIEAEGEEHLVKMSVVSIKRKGVIVEESGRLKKGTLKKYIDKSVFYESKIGALWRSALLPGWGQIYQQRPEVGAFYALTAASLLTGGLLAYQEGQDHSARYAEGLSSSVPYRLQANSAFSRANLFWGGLGIIWVTSAIDAYLSGKDHAHFRLNFNPQGGLSLSGAF